ncbi:alpha/beta fold hydrolase [Nocardia brasiliensis]|uniref:alpha/beta fold hydrolase n=1 Tax=Nocardia brasiliensis TaxID=37326 RepID=UPI00366B1C69
MDVLTVDADQLAYTIDGQGPPVVLVHAGIADHRMWDAIVPALVHAYTVIRYDMRGFGESSVPTAPFGHHEDLRRILDHLGYETARIVGASFGGRVVVNFALTHPDRVHSLVLLNPPWPGYDGSAEMIACDEAETAALAAGALDTAVQVNLDMWLRGPVHDWADVRPDLVGELEGALRISLMNMELVDRYERGVDWSRPATPASPSRSGASHRRIPPAQHRVFRWRSGVFSTVRHPG